MGAGIVLFILIPTFEPNDEIRKWFDVLMLAILAMSWNFIGGLTGYPSFGPAAFFGLGAYLTAIFMNFGTPFIATLFIGAFAGALLAFVLGIPILRLKGHYFAIASYGVAEAPVSGCGQRYVSDLPERDQVPMSVDVQRGLVQPGVAPASGAPVAPEEPFMLDLANP